MLFAFFTPERVLVGGLQHLLPIIIAAIFGFLIIRYSKKSLNEIQQKRLLHVFGIIVSLIVVVFHSYQIVKDNYNFKTDLPLYLCSFMALIIPVFTYYRKYWMYEILVFWIIAGTSQGVITPDIAEGFPAFDYFRYWVVHLGLLGIIFYATFVFNMRPKFPSVFKSILVLLLYIIIMMLLNYMLGANYSYLNYKPESASVLDYLGEWPWYLVQALLLLIPYFLLILVFFQIGKKRRDPISQTTD